MQVQREREPNKKSFIKFSFSIFFFISRSKKKLYKTPQIHKNPHTHGKKKYQPLIIKKLIQIDSRFGKKEKKEDYSKK